MAIGDHRLAGIEPGIDHRRGLVGHADLDHPFLHRAVFPDDERIRPARPLLNDRDRHRHHVTADIDLDAHIDELPGPQHVARVFEYRLEVDGRGVRIDQVVDHRKLARRQRGACAVLGRYLDIPLPGRGPNRRQGVGWKRERDEDRVELIDDDDAAGIGRLDHVAGVDQPGSGTSVERRTDAAVIELNLSAVDRGLIGLNACLELLHQRARRIELLTADRPGRGKAREAVEIEARILKKRFVPELVRLRLVERRLIRFGIDFDQHVTEVNILAFGEIDLLDLAVDP